MVCKVYCACCSGLEVSIVTVEVAVSEGVQLYLVGLPDSAVKESQQRIGSALEYYGFRIPGKKIVVNLAPANIRKEGSAFDTAIAVGILLATGQISGIDPSGSLILGELALDGSLRPVPGALPVIIHARDAGKKACIMPRSSAAEGAGIEGIEVYRADNLKDVIDILCRREGYEEKLVRPGSGATDAEEPLPACEYDFADVKGQRNAKFALEIAAAGGHNVIMTGSPGSGKTFMAKCLQGILPPMTKEESIETSKIYSVAGLLGSGPLMRRRPFRAPHHTITVTALTGGGNNGLPGEISLAHNGVLFCDEFTEFDRRAIDVMRQPLEDGIIQVSRVKGKYCYPARFMFVAAMNPCPCGFLFDEPGRCGCSGSAISRYRGKISGPVYDRIDINLKIRKLGSDDLVRTAAGRGGTAGLRSVKEESSAEIAERVMLARGIQNERFRKNGETFFTNSAIPAPGLSRYCALGREELLFMKKIAGGTGMTARGFSRILKIARTIADVECARSGSDDISSGIRTSHLAAAITLRCPESGEIC